MSDISVVMGTYNGGSYLREQLDSILAQTEPPAEIVIGDDGSTDDTLAVAEAVAGTTPVPIRIHRNPQRLGFAENFLQAVRRSTGRYIAFSDQDDRWMPEKLAKGLAALVEHEALLCTHPMHLIDAAGRRIGLDTQEITSTHVIEPLTADPWGVYFGFTLLFDRTLLDLIPADRRGMDTHKPADTLSHDRWVYFLASNLGRIVALAEPLAEYRQHGANVYGVKHVSLPQRVRNKIEEGPPKLKFLAEAAQHRVDLFEASARTDDAASWQAAAQRWRRIQRHCETRHSLYVGKGLGRRTALLASNVGAGAYRDFANGGLGRKRLVEDVTLGLFGRFAARL